MNNAKSNIDKLPYTFINGSYLATVIDLENNNFSLFNDLLGLIPLYHFHNKNHFFFSTEIHLLANHPEYKFIWDRSVIDEYLEYGTIISGKSVLEGISMLPGASIIEFDGNKPSIKRWHVLPKESSYTKYVP